MAAKHYNSVHAPKASKEKTPDTASAISEPNAAVAKAVSPQTLKRQIQWLLFAAAFVAFAYFHQGGGWNQNGRFAMVRAMAEQGKFWVDDYLIYRPAEAGSTTLVRVPISNAEYVMDGQVHGLVWSNAQGLPLPINRYYEGPIMALDAFASRLDVGVHFLGQDPQRKAILSLSITPNTQFLKNGQRVESSAFRVGDIVKASFLESPDRRSLLADEIIASDRNVAYTELGNVGATGDTAFERGHFHPNKAPGTSFIAVPIYFLIYRVEKLFGVNPDELGVLTQNAWFTSVFSVGLLSAIGIVLLYRLALMLSGGRMVASLLTAFAFAFGTMFFPYATMLYEHNIIAVGLIASFYLLYRVKTAQETPGGVGLSKKKADVYLLLSGVCGGYAAITNYIIAAVVLMLGAYALFAVRRKWSWLWFTLGVFGPLLLICTYNQICFGTPFTTNYRHQNPMFSSGDKALLNVFIWPGSFSGSSLEKFELYVKEVASVATIVMFSPFRGLFYNAPVLLVGVFGIYELFRRKKFRAEAWLIAAVLLFFLIFISHYNGWHGGWATAPRYLGPAIPFLALPMVFGFMRFPKIAITLASIAAAIQLLTTAVDPQSPLGNGGHAVVQNRPQWEYNPLTEYELPLFLTGRAWPLMRAQIEEVIKNYYEPRVIANLAANKQLSERERTETRINAVDQQRRQLENSVKEGKPASLIIVRVGRGPLDYALANPSDMPAVAGPVSANPMGIYEGWMHRLFPPNAPQARFNSFNIGEFGFEESRWSLLPLLVVGSVLIWMSVRMALKLEIPTAPPPTKKAAKN